MSKTLILIPAYNEEQNIGRVLANIRDLHLGLDVLVVNDGSKDKTAEMVKREHAYLISHPYNMGYGAAMQTGFKYAVYSGYKQVIQFDADGQHDPEDIKTILRLLETENADIVIGSRFLGRGNFRTGWMKKAAIVIFRWIIKTATGASVTDPTSGLQGLKRCAFSYYAGMGNYPADFPDADILIQMLRSGFQVREFPANIRQRDFGESMHSGLKPILYFFKILLSILVVLMRQKASTEECEV